MFSFNVTFISSILIYVTFSAVDALTVTAINKAIIPNKIFFIYPPWIISTYIIIMEKK